MKRKIIQIDEEKCNGCGACVTACHEGAIGLVDGKAKLLRDDYCDGLGNCLPACPTGAISFVEREAAPYNEAAVLANKQGKKEEAPLPCGCPGTRSRQFVRNQPDHNEPHPKVPASMLAQWPVQIKLVPVNAPYFDGAHLLVAADCAAYARGSFHSDFMRNKITIIGCPKLDMVDYTEKLTAILKNNDIKSLTVVRMEVPCCGGIEAAAKNALRRSDKFIPWQVVTLSTEGDIID